MRHDLECRTEHDGVVVDMKFDNITVMFTDAQEIGDKSVYVVLGAPSFDDIEQWIEWNVVGPERERVLNVVRRCRKSWMEWIDIPSSQ